MHPAKFEGTLNLNLTFCFLCWHCWEAPSNSWFVFKRRAQKHCQWKCTSCPVMSTSISAWEQMLWKCGDVCCSETNIVFAWSQEQFSFPDTNFASSFAILEIMFSSLARPLVLWRFLYDILKMIANLLYYCAPITKIVFPVKFLLVLSCT